MFLLGRFAAATAALLLANAVFVPSASETKAAGPTATSSDSADLAILASPLAPWKGAPLRVLFATEKSFNGELALIAPDGSVAAKSHERHGGPPYFWIAEVASPAAGTWRAALTCFDATRECTTMTREIVVRGDEPPRPRAASGTVWPLRN